ncbi:acyltransferase [Mycetocola zhujimingii]|uniref:Acyltransferase n=1 Tax=Mycetocola zhujimingii TaxID=2079792 RepID=A0A2U1TFS2_9MICO|nr:hypothetical protein [Mycetocola zhujimingii]PWC07748.1 hypothetical protein DF223_04635 [Mycetocola zhujimingii]
MAVWLLPAGPVKNRLLRRLGHQIDPGARARSNFVWGVDSFVMEPGSRIGKWNLIKHMSTVSVGSGASIGRLNVISSHPVYVRLYPVGARLDLGSRAKITSRHQLDCSGGLRVGELSSIAGHDTRVLSHSVDLARDAQVAYPIVIGERSFVGARCLLLGGAVLPARSVLAAGSVLPHLKGHPAAGLWAGVPAEYKRPVSGEWFDRETTSTSRVFIPDTDTTVENAL